MNIALLLVLFCILLIAFCTRMSPNAMRALAAWLRATAEASEEHKRRHVALIKQYRQEMGLKENDRINAKVEVYARTQTGDGVPESAL